MPAWQAVLEAATMGPVYLSAEGLEPVPRFGDGLPRRLVGVRVRGVVPPRLIEAVGQSQEGSGRVHVCSGNAMTPAVNPPGSSLGGNGILDRALDLGRRDTHAITGLERLLRRRR